MSPTTAAVSDRFAVRNVAVLVFAQAVLGAQMPMVFIMGGLAGQQLATNKCFATLPISLVVLGSMFTAPVISQIMQHRGRSFGFALGAVGGGLGALLCVIALCYRSFPLFLFGSLLTGVYMSAQAFYRFAAADTASEEFRPKAISYVMAGGLLSAVFGPQLFKASVNAFAIPFIGAYVVVIVLNLLGVFIFLGLKIPVPGVTQSGDNSGRSRLQLLRTPRILVAMICAMVSFSLMNLVMTSTPLAVVGCGFKPAIAADIVMSHVLAMFIPSFFTGHLIVRFGAEKIIAIGLVILGGAGLIALSGIELGNFFVALILLGLGWNFGYIGATALLTAAHTSQERGRLQGMNDMMVFAMVTLASLSSGGLMNCSGSSPAAGWQAVNYAMVPFLVLAGAALVWLARSERQATSVPPNRGGPRVPSSRG